MSLAVVVSVSALIFDLNSSKHTSIFTVASLKIKFKQKATRKWLNSLSQSADVSEIIAGRAAVHCMRASRWPTAIGIARCRCSIDSIHIFAAAVEVVAPPHIVAICRNADSLINQSFTHLNLLFILHTDSASLDNLWHGIAQTAAARNERNGVWKSKKAKTIKWKEFRWLERMSLFLLFILVDGGCAVTSGSANTRFHHTLWQH